MKGTPEETDKVYWHNYVRFYEDELESFQCDSVLEFGVWRGASIRWLMSLFPATHIYGVDILDVQPSWPKDERVKYLQVDQGDISQIKGMFKAIDSELDLVIEDGSHLPEHQRNCLVESVSHIRSGGIYILEDIHTSHPSHRQYRKSKSRFKPMIGPLHLLLAINHLKTVSEKSVQDRMCTLSKNSLFDYNDVHLLWNKIDSVRIFKRTTLPNRCFACGDNDFDYSMLMCSCGVSLYAEADSMSALIRLK